MARRFFLGVILFAVAAEVAFLLAKGIRSRRMIPATVYFTDPLGAFLLFLVSLY
ncbi:MAG: hypothetical protein GX493_02125 [Firmicutes bacterium]|nr:hypothetical protein [Bacillota bacterium]